MKELRIELREPHLYKDVDVFFIYYVAIECEDDAAVDIPVIDGVAYVNISCNNYVRIMAAAKESPEELAKNPNIELIYIEKIN